MVLSIAEELENSAANALPCAEHANMECGLVCIDCLVGICYKCLTSTEHHGHHLEEPAKAEALLAQKLKDVLQPQEDSAKQKILKIEASMGNSTTKIGIETVYNFARRAIETWRNDQSAHLQVLQKRQEASMNEAKEIVQTLKNIQNGNITLPILLKKIKQANINDTTESEPLELPSENIYDLTSGYKFLLEFLRQALEQYQFSFDNRLLANTGSNNQSRSGEASHSQGRDLPVMDTSDEDSTEEPTPSTSQISAKQKHLQRKRKRSTSPSESSSSE